MAEGRCYLSSYLTGESPNTVGACSPARFVRWQQTPHKVWNLASMMSLIGPLCSLMKMQGILLLCKGRYFLLINTAITPSKSQPA